jgi:hypothetical protein
MDRGPPSGTPGQPKMGGTVTLRKPAWPMPTGTATRSSLSADGLPRRPQEGNGAVSRQYRVANEWLDGLGQYHGANEWLDGAISGALRT